LKQWLDADTPVDVGSTISGIEIAAPERPKSSLVRNCIAVALLSSVAVAIVAWRHPWRRSEVIERKLTTNSSENSVTSAVVSPDGKYLAYTDSTGIYLKLIRTGEIHAVPLPAEFRK
jgi:hypothetical protein